MKFGIVSQWFDPEPGPASLPGTLARSLASRGHEVQVLTGFPNYPSGKIADGYKMQRRRDEVVDNVKIRRVALYPSHDKSSVGRVLNYTSFGLNALLSGIDVLRDADAVWVSNSPVTVGIPMWGLGKGAKRRPPLVLHILDLWPDNIISSGLISNPTLLKAVEGGVHRWNRSMYDRAQYVAGISPGIVDLVARRGVPSDKLRYIPMWANEDDFFPSTDESLRVDLDVPDDRVVVLYAGTLGRAQGIDSLIRACQNYPGHAPPLECWIAGSGIEEQALRAAAESIANANIKIRFFGRVPSQEMQSLMASADIHFVGLRGDDNSAITMPSKIQATMASGKPMIIAVPGDARAVVFEAEAGLGAQSDDPSTITKAMVRSTELGRADLREMGTNARIYYEQNFSLTAGTDRIEELLIKASKENRQ